MFVHGFPFQPSQMFVGKAGVYLSLTVAPLLTLPTDIGLGWNNLPGTSTLADYEHS